MSGWAYFVAYRALKGWKAQLGFGFRIFGFQGLRVEVLTTLMTITTVHYDASFSRRVAWLTNPTCTRNTIRKEPPYPLRPKQRSGGLCWPRRVQVKLPLHKWRTQEVFSRARRLRPCHICTLATAAISSNTLRQSHMNFLVLDPPTTL